MEGGDDSSTRSAACDQRPRRRWRERSAVVVAVRSLSSLPFAPLAAPIVISTIRQCSVRSHRSLCSPILSSRFSSVASSAVVVRCGEIAAAQAEKGGRGSATEVMDQRRPAAHSNRRTQDDIARAGKGGACARWASGGRDEHGQRSNSRDPGSGHGSELVRRLSASHSQRRPPVPPLVV